MPPVLNRGCGCCVDTNNGDNGGRIVALFTLELIADDG